MKYQTNLQDTKLCVLASLRSVFAREAVGGKPAKTGGDVPAATKKRPEEALFVALRAHAYRLRTWSRTPAAKPTRPKEDYEK